MNLRLFKKIRQQLNKKVKTAQGTPAGDLWRLKRAIDGGTLGRKGRKAALLGKIPRVHKG